MPNRSQSQSQSYFTNQLCVPPLFREGPNIVATPNSSSIILCLYVAVKTCVNFLATVWFSHKPIRCCGNVPGEPLSSNELLWLSGVMPQYVGVHRWSWVETSISVWLNDHKPQTNSQGRYLSLLYLVCCATYTTAAH
jgi:hypothetical protein